MLPGPPGRRPCTTHSGSPSTAGCPPRGNSTAATHSHAAWRAQAGQRVAEVQHLHRRTRPCCGGGWRRGSPAGRACAQLLPWVQVLRPGRWAPCTRGPGGGAPHRVRISAVRVRPRQRGGGGVKWVACHCHCHCCVLQRGDGVAACGGCVWWLRGSGGPPRTMVPPAGGAASPGIQTQASAAVSTHWVLLLWKCAARVPAARRITPCPAPHAHTLPPPSQQQQAAQAAPPSGAPGRCGLA